MKKYHQIRTALRRHGEDDSRWWYVQSVMKEKSLSMTEFIREAIDIHREHAERGGFVSVSDVEDHLIWRIEGMLRGKVVTSPSIDGASIDGAEDIETVIDFDPSKYGI